ncbi:MAG TPA: PEGA domain-containing protein [Candidatus Paceibacterota bacterium]
MRHLSFILAVLLSACTVGPSRWNSSNSISSTPEDALVILDDHPIGKTPMNISLNNAVQNRDVNHTLIFKKEGYKDAFYTLSSIHDGDAEIGDFLFFTPFWLIFKLTDSDHYYYIAAERKGFQGIIPINISVVLESFD